MKPALLISTLISLLLIGCPGGSGGDSSPTLPDPSSPVTTDNATLSAGFYAVGSTRDSNEVMTGAYWVNGVRTDLSKLDSTKSCEAKGIAASGTHTYISGYCIDSNNKTQFGRWDNGVWSSFNPPSGYTYQIYPSMAVLNGNTYIPGYRYSSPGVYLPGYFLNDTWIELPSLDSSKTSLAARVRRINNDIYFVGYSHNTSNQAVAGYWKNGVWTEMLAPGLASYINNISGITSVNQDLYIVGTYQASFNAASNALQWLGISKTTLPPLDSAKGCTTTGIATRFGDIYIAGRCSQGTNYVPGFWKNSAWTSLSSLDASKIVSPNLIIVTLDKKVYMCGIATDSANIQKAVYWQDGALHQLSAIDSTKASVCADALVIN